MDGIEIPSISWTRYLASPSLSFLTFKMGLISNFQKLVKELNEENFCKNNSIMLVSNRCSMKPRLNKERKGSTKGKERDRTVIKTNPYRVPNPTFIWKVVSLWGTIRVRRGPCTFRLVVPTKYVICNQEDSGVLHTQPLFALLHTWMFLTLMI